jgi:hypothetical protein
VNSFNATDAATGNFVVTVTGHRFLPIPCVDANGAPTVDQTCAKTTTARSWASCTGGACHGDAIAARSAYDAATTRIDDLVTELNALLALVPANQFSNADTVFTVAEGARFNQELGEIRSSAIHNPFLTEALLDGSIEAVMDTYGLPAQTGVRLGTIWPQLVPASD